MPIKTQHLKAAMRPARKVHGVRTKSIGALLLLTATVTPAPAVDKVWSPSDSTSWNDSFNWNPAGVPVAGDTATFDGTTQISPTINAPVTIDSITFVPGASVFSIQVAPSGVGLTLQGVGIVNNSGQTQTIINSGILLSSTSFTAGATAGNATIINSGILLSLTSFTTGATAGNATIFNSGRQLHIIYWCFNGGTLEALGSCGGITSSKPVSLAAGGGTFLADAGTASTLSAPITGMGAWTKAGPGTLTLTGANTYSGGTMVSAGTLQLGAGGTVRLQTEGFELLPPKSRSSGRPSPCMKYW